MSDDSITDISLQLGPIEIHSTLNNQNLINTLCSMFLMAGPNMLYLTDEEADGQVYFTGNNLIAVYWDDLKEEEALLKILSLDYAGVKIVRGQSPDDMHFKMSLQDFLKVAAPDQVKTMSDFNAESQSLRSIKSLNFIKGFLALKDNVIVYHRDLIPDAVPIDYLRSLLKGDTVPKGIYCKVNQLQGKQTYYTMNQSGLTWIFQLKKSADRTNLYEILSKTISRAVQDV